MADTVIREVAHNVWTFSRPFMLGMVPMGGRSTAIKLESGGVWILASTELNDETKQKLDDLDVKYIVAGNNAHHFFIRQYKVAYPNAKVLCSEDLLSKPESQGIKLDTVFSATTPNPSCGFETEIETCYFTGYANKDIACYHKASKTVMAADLLFNNPPTEQFSKSPQSPKSMLFASMTSTGWQMRLLLRAKTQDRAAMRRDAAKVHSWDFDRFIPCHGDVVETGARAAWRSAFTNYLS
ncbi:hypothetical protein L226DRAFT_562191 [Lentinus tigrinus ALCF2SS1-7]|uniref:DUF4336 domain-containing protein n=1 Tax=Lentinus tigrinus ALCF2SS1-6 TaxID=1328759 RepID=A0A5C2S0H5_9APHY|nr:hypothetical protein L227DRAFT_614038 [Lentinus tigrinus ALCF2SS1-6]RPD71805.1 hypothetical protein L226DRAFT_562191 [Lentinus tigrinus ALCF2SS1-7]